MNILHYFPSGRQPRPIQQEALQQIEKYWNTTQLFVLNLPVAAGKSNIAHTVANWAYQEQQQRSAILTPTNILVDQYRKDFPRLHTVGRIDSYICKRYNNQAQRLNCQEARKVSTRKKLCPGCPFTKDLIKAQKWAPIGLYNNYTYLFVKPPVPILIIDEAHKVIDVVREMAAKVYWQHKLGYPSSIKTYGQLYRWVKGTITKVSPTSSKGIQLTALLAEMENNKARYLLQRTEDYYYGELRDCIKFLPIDVRDYKPIFWPPSRVKKIILLSATLNRKDVEQLGLDKKTTVFIGGPSPIPASNRPLQVIEEPLDLSLHGVQKSLPRLATIIKDQLQTNQSKGIIHVTYNLMEQLRPHLEGQTRLLFHSRDNKKEQYRLFRESPPEAGKVLLAAGLYEGVDLPEELGRWQLIVKVPWPSLGEPAVAWMAKNDPEWYANEAVKIICQAYGRICRTPTDYGKTIILDRSFLRLYNDWKELFPEWFQEVVV